MADPAKAQMKILDRLARALAGIPSTEVHAKWPSVRKTLLVNRFRRLRAIRDTAEAVRYNARTARLGLEVQNRAAELKLRAERRAGAMLAAELQHGGDRRTASADGRSRAR